MGPVVSVMRMMGWQANRIHFEGMANPSRNKIIVIIILFILTIFNVYIQSDWGFIQMQKPKILFIPTNNPEVSLIFSIKCESKVCRPYSESVTMENILEIFQHSILK